MAEAHILMLFLVCALLVINSVSADQSQVTTNLGAIQGTIGNGWVEFLGIPYAEPPLGKKDCHLRRRFILRIDIIAHVDALI